MATITAVLRKEKENKAGLLPLYLRITQNRKSRYISLKEWMPEEQWDAERERVRKNHPYSVRLNNFISKKKAEAMEAVLQKESEMEDLYSARQVKDSIKGPRTVDFFQFAQRRMVLLEQRGQYGTLGKLKSVVNKIRKFWPKKHLYFHQITVAFLNQYQVFLLEEFNNKPNTIGADLKVIRRIYNYAVNEDLASLEKNPFLRFKIKWEKSRREYLTEDQLAAIEAVELKPGTRMYVHRDIFVFSCWVGGLRISDMLLLKWKFFDGQRLELGDIFKTGQPLGILVPPRGLQILDTYTSPEKGPNDYIFPILKKGYEDDNLILHNKIESATAYLNKNLKIIAEKAEVPISLTSHIARHTWATRALRRGMRLEYVSKLMGHSTVKETQIYAKIVNSELDKAMEVFND